LCFSIFNFTSFIISSTLGQAIKAAGLVESGVEAKIVIQDGEVKVNGVVETQRGKKLFGGEVVEYNGSSILIKK
jgi:ribosome-associated protein